MEIDASSPFSRAFDHASSQIGLRFQNPLYPLTEVFTGSSFRASLVEVKRFGKQIVTEARRRRARNAFESLINNTNEEEAMLQKDREEGRHDSDGLGFGTLIDSLIESLADPTIVADAALNFLSAARDTTAQSLTWTFYALLRHPESLRRVREEIEAVFPKHANEDDDAQSDGSSASATAVNVALLQPTSLPYTMAAFYESLRLYPPVPFEIKQTTQPITLPDGTFLPSGAIVVWCIWALNRSTKTFGPDAHEFRPERWLSTEDDTSASTSDSTNGLKPKVRFTASSLSAGEFPVFNGGPRACLGKKMAELMACWVIVRLLCDWEFEEVNDGLNMQMREDNGWERRSANSLTLPMEGGLPVRVRRRV